SASGLRPSSHRSPCARRHRDATGKLQRRASVARCPPEPRLDGLTPRAFIQAVAQLTLRGGPQHSCRWQLLWWPGNGGYHAERKSALYTLVDPVSPPPQPALRHGLWWRCRVPPPGPMGLLRQPFIAIAGPSTGTLNIRRPERYAKASGNVRQRPGQQFEDVSPVRARCVDDANAAADRLRIAKRPAASGRAKSLT